MHRQCSSACWLNLTVTFAITWQSLLLSCVVLCLPCREAEVIHARWAMLGVISLLLSDISGSPFPPKEVRYRLFTHLLAMCTPSWAQRCVFQPVVSHFPVSLSLLHRAPFQLPVTCVCCRPAFLRWRPGVLLCFCAWALLSRTAWLHCGTKRILRSEHIQVGT